MSKSQQKSQTVLVIDDSQTIRKMLVTILSEDYNIIEAESGAIGLELIQNDVEPDLILLDLCMPGIDGYEFMNSLIASGKKIPTVLLSAYITDLKKDSVGLFKEIIDKKESIDKVKQVVDKVLKDQLC